jgi:signal transduction histidine kinase
VTATSRKSAPESGEKHRAEREPRAAPATSAAAPAASEAGEPRALVVRSEEDGWLGRLAGGVVHELKNPLSTMHLNLELLRDEWARGWQPVGDAREPGVPERCEAPAGVVRRSLRRLDTVLRETRRLDAMLKDFLRFSRADRLVLERVKLAALADEVLAFVAPDCALRRIEVRREVEAGLPAIEADPMLVKQALLNLVQNAQDAMAAAGGTITVRLSREAGGVRIEVADTGAGIPAAELPRLFELYRTTKPDGTGLGLATTKRIVEAHGGRVEVVGGPGGARFAIALPLGRALEPPRVE